MKRGTKVARISVFLAAIVAVAATADVGRNASAQHMGQHGWGGGNYWQPGWMHRDMWGQQSATPEMRARMQRHWAFMHGNIPAAYAKAQSTVKSTPEVIKEGGVLYQQHCGSCHGSNGLGNGEAGKGLTPSPALLAYMIQRPVAVDEFLLWTIAEGGAQFGTAMPAFKDQLTREEIWKIVAYMRQGFPATASK